MLVLSRHFGEKIVFPQLGIEVMVVGRKNNGAISLGINCPDDVICHRSEIQRKIESQVPNTVTGGDPAPVRFWDASQRLKRNKVAKDKPQTAEEKGGDQQS